MSNDPAPTSNTSERDAATPAPALRPGFNPPTAPGDKLPDPRITHRDSRAAAIGCLLLLAIALQVAVGHRIRLSQWQLDADHNAAVAEAVAWLNGRLDLPVKGPNPADPDQRSWDTACFKDPVTGQLKSFNVFPPLMTFLTVALHPIHHHLFGLPEGIWSPWTFVWLIYWPLPIVAFMVLRRRVGNSAWAALLAFALIAGTAVLPNLDAAGRGLLGQLNHVLSQVGLLILADDLLGKRRLWPALIGLAIATWSRQMTFLYGLPILYFAWRDGRLPRAALCALGLAAIAAPLLVLNQLKFGNAFDFGYQYIYVGREEGAVAQRCLQHGVFSPRFIPENAWFMHVEPPRIAELSPIVIRLAESNEYGTSLWLTSPLAFFVLLAAPKWWHERPARILLLATLPIMVGLLCYHSPGWVSQGYSRFALDYLPVWLVAIAPWTRGKWQTPLTLACIAWSCWYFESLT